MADEPVEYFDPVEVDVETLKIREIEELEEISGMSVDSLDSDDAPKGKLLRALAYIYKKRENPDFTLEDAGELVIKPVSDSDPKEQSEQTVS
tara:strand:- start:1185 stop:1460 length:276 start_codon:yes stop_codon:yes gene_type:complete